MNKSVLFWRIILKHYNIFSYFIKIYRIFWDGGTINIENENQHELRCNSKNNSLLIRGFKFEIWIWRKFYWEYHPKWVYNMIFKLVRSLLWVSSTKWQINKKLRMREYIYIFFNITQLMSKISMDGWPCCKISQTSLKKTPYSSFCFPVCFLCL